MNFPFSSAQTVFQSARAAIRDREKSNISAHTWLEACLATDDSAAQVVARLALGLVIFPHGAQKALGWFGGFGFYETVNMFSQMGVPQVLAWLAIFAEFFGSLGLLFGFFARLSALGIMCNMLVAVWMVHGQYGFFMNWNGAQGGEGIEFHVLALGLGLIVLFAGAGRFSLDRELYRITRGF